jgi:flagellar basal-body rod protein FlgB
LRFIKWNFCVQEQPMSSLMFGKGMIPVMERVSAFTHLRQKMISNNIANVDTPFYKAVDAPVTDFQDAMKSAMTERDRRVVPVFTLESNRGAKVDGAGRLSLDAVKVQGEHILAHNENTVSIENEMVKMAQNQMLHNAATQLLIQQFGMIESAIREQV